MMMEVGRHLQSTFASSQTAPIVDKDVDTLIDYLTKAYTADSDNDNDFEGAEVSEQKESSSNKDQSEKSSSSSPLATTATPATPTTATKTTKTTTAPSNEEWKTFQNVSLQALCLCLDIYPNNGVLSDKQKKKIVFHGLLQLGSTPLTFTFDSSSSIIVQLLKDALEIILSTALLSDDGQHSNTSNNQNSKNTTIGIEMLLTPYLSRLEQQQSNNNENNNTSTNIHQYIIRICNSKLNPMNAAALINSIIALLSSFSSSSSSSAILHVASALSTNHITSNNKLFSNEMMESFFGNLFNCLYDLANMNEYDSIPPLIYQICQLINNGNFNDSSSSSLHAAFILSSIISFLEHMLDNSTIIAVNRSSKSNSNNDDNDDDKNDHKNNREIQWTIFTSLNHLGSVLRGNPLLPNVLLNILKGKEMKKKSTVVVELNDLIPAQSLSSSSTSSSSSSSLDTSPPPFRYLKMTPILLAIGLTMATYIPRMRDSTLDAIRDLVYEESLIRIKRAKSNWFNACAAMLLASKDLKMNIEGKLRLKDLVGRDGNTDAAERKRQEWENSLKKEVEEYQNYEDGDNDNLKTSHMLYCLKSFLSMTCGVRDPAQQQQQQQQQQRKNRENKFHETQTNSDLYPALVALGFLLIDSVKKDIKIPFSNSASTNVHLVKELPSCTNAMNQNSNTSIQKDTQAATAQVGRELLKTMFLFVGMNYEEDDVVISNTGYISHATLNPLCRSIVMTMFEKFCCMAPNAIEHSYLLRDIAFASLDSQANEDIFMNVVKSVHVEKYVGASMLEESFLSNIIDSLSNVPGGGMPPAAAMVSVIPTLRHILQIAIKKELRNRRYSNQLDSHFDHCFLLAKKALFCTDVERRKVAVQLLVMLIDLALERSKNDADKNVSHSSSSMVDEGIGYLRRCLTQHQSDVRLEVYVSLVSSVPKFNEIDDENEDGDSSPEIATSISVVSQILLSHLERYVHVQEDKTIVQARRKRAIQLGTHLSQQPVDSDDEQIAEESAPLRLQMCTRSSSRMATRQLKQGNKRKKSNGNSSFIDEVTSCILEPISFLLASSTAVIREATKHPYLHESTKALLKILQDLQEKVSETNIDNYLHDNELDNCSDSKSARAVSTCILVASIAETLMEIPQVEESTTDLGVIEKLFKLRSEAVMKGSTVLATRMTKPNNQKKRKTNGSKKKRVIDDDEDNDEGNQDVKIEAKIKPQLLSKSRRLIEDVILSICPSNTSSFFSKCLRKCGVLSQKKDSDDRLEVYQEDDEMEDQSVETRLSANADFRRFLLEKTEALLQGNSLVLRTGDRFDCDHFIDGNDPIRLYYIICSLQLGPICLVEFCAHVNRRELTSLVAQDSTPLAQVALQAFIHSIQRMTSYVKGHNMSKVQRLKTLLKSSIDALCTQFPSVKSRVDLLSQNQDVLATTRGSEIENNLTQLILPLIFPIRQDNPEITCCGLLSELIESGLDDEAMLCCHMLACTMIHFNPDLRQTMGLIILKCFENCNPGSTKEGLLGLQHDSSLSSSDGCGKSASQAIDIALYLGGQMDSMTRLIGLDSSSAKSNRSLSGFADSPKSLFERIYGQKIESEDNTCIDDELYGIPKLLAMSFLHSIGVHHDFQEKHLTSLDKLGLKCTELIATTSTGNDTVSKDIVSASSTISNMVDAALVDAEFVASKVLTAATGVSLTIVQELLASRLVAVTEAISSYAPGSLSFDNQSSFITFLLKCTKRIHVTLSKLVSSYSTCPKNSMLTQSKALLQLWSGKFNRRTMSLLLVLQGQHRTKDGKVLADSKIMAQGRIAAQVVFEKEKADSAILNLSSKFKAKGINSDFLKEKIIVSTHRDFKIKIHELPAARERNANKLKKKKSKSGAKNKAEKKLKKTERAQDHDSGSDSDDEQATIDENSLAENEMKNEDDRDEDRDQTLTIESDNSDSESDEEE